MKPPFKMRTETEMEKYRYETWDTKEPETIEWINSFEPNSVFFDVGANIGVYSLYAVVKSGVCVIAFEPMPCNFTVLCDNIYRNNNTSYMIKAYPWAVGNKCGITSLSIPTYDAGTSGAQMARGKNEYRCRVIRLDKLSVPVVTHCLSDDGPGATFVYYPDYVKIDIDGQELAVIQGMTKTLPYVKSILIEVSRASKQPIMDILTAAGFTTDNRFNTMTPHSRERREKEGIDAENIIFTR